MIFSPVEWQYDFVKFSNSDQGFQLSIHPFNQHPLIANTVSLYGFNRVFDAASKRFGDLSGASSQPLEIPDITDIFADNLAGNFAGATLPFVVDSTGNWVNNGFDFGGDPQVVATRPAEELGLLSQSAAAAIADPFVDFTDLLNTISFTRSNLASFSLLGTHRFNTSPTANNYFVTHGYQSSADVAWVGNINDAIKGFDAQANVILVDWEDGANPSGLFGFDYAQAAENTFEVGQQLAELLSALPVNPDGVQLIGHSLGAHVSGVAGDYYEDLTGRDLGVIVGMDPAGPGFEGPDFFNGFSIPALDERLDATDAERVVAYHTSDTLGYDDPLGDLDLYVNPDDFFQPGQSSFVGNHGYAHTLYTQLLNGQTFAQPDGSVFDYGAQFTLAGNVNIETVV